jgi:hypothetical protein
MTTPISSSYMCLCGWESDTQPDQWRCPDCNELVAGSAISIEEPAVWTPPQFVVSPWQRKTRPFSRNFWTDVVSRVRQGALTMDPKDLAEAVLPYLAEETRPVRRPRGRPRRGPFRDRDHCLQWLRQLAVVCLKSEWPITKERLGQLGGGSGYLRTRDPESAARTITRWCEKYHIDFEEDVQNYF